jgi:serine/threonine-protein kinase
MSSTIGDRRSASSPEPSREEVRRQFLAACAATKDGPPPDLESFIALFDEPERSSVREELEHLRQSQKASAPTKVDRIGETRASDLGTIDHVPDVGGTIDHPPDAAGTIDHPSAEPKGAEGGTVDPMSPGATTDHARSRRKKAAKEVPLPQSVAGYEIISVLGRGAMGVVYKARQRGLDRLVALKMILSGEHASEMDLNRFRAEANAVAQCHHPGIVQIYEVGEDAGRPFFSLEFVDGQSLHSKIQGTPLPPKEAATLLKKMAEAMAYAHERSIIHRDLKPANVLLTEGGEPKIGDFGLAKRIQDDESGMTRTGTVLGTPSYMSPEQAEGRIHDIGPLADVYSLGAVLYDMLTGRPPFRGTSMLDTLEQLRTREPVPPMQFQPGVPRDLETICLKCLQKDPARRYASAEELAADLGRFLRGEPILARPVSLAERLVRWCRRNPGKASVIVAAVLGVIGWAVTASGLTLWANAERSEAVRAGNLAIANAAEAREQTRIAKENERIQHTMAEISLDGMSKISKNVHNMLQSKRLALADIPEMRKLRADALRDLRGSLLIVNQNMRRAATTTFADVAAAQRIGDMLMTFGQVKEARGVYEEGHQSAVKRLEAEPNSDPARANLGVMENRLGDVDLEQTGDARSALAHYLKARELREGIQKQPKSGEYSPEVIKILVAQDDVRLGKVLLALGQPAAARKYLQEAIDFRNEWLARDEKTTGEARSYMVEARMWMGVAAWHLKDAAQVDEQFSSALALERELLKQFNDDPDFMMDLAEVHGHHGDALLRLGKLAEAEKSYSDGMAAVQYVLKKQPDDITHQPLLALMHERLGMVNTLQKKEDVARPHLKQARDLRKGLWEVDNSVLSLQIGWVLTIARDGDRKEALVRVNIIRNRMVKSPELMLQVARVFAICSTDAALGQKENIAQAISALQGATGDDYKDAVVLKTDPDLAVLREEAGFKELVARIEAR